MNKEKSESNRITIQLSKTQFILLRGAIPGSIVFIYLLMIKLWPNGGFISMKYFISQLVGMIFAAYVGGSLLWYLTRKKVDSCKPKID